MESIDYATTERNIRNLKLLQDRDIGTLYEENKGLIIKLVTRYGDLVKYEFDDILQVASIGFMDAVQHYDESRGCCFSTFLGSCVENRIRNFQIRDRNNKLDTISIYEPIHTDTEGKHLYVTDLPSKYLSVEDSVTYNLIMEYINTNLTGKQRTIMLNYINGVNQVETAKQVGVTQSIVSRKISKIKKNIRKLYGFQQGE